MIHTETINTLTKFCEHTTQWDRISSVGMSPTRHIDWVTACALSFTHDVSIYILTVNDQTLPVSMAPFCLNSKPMPHLEILGVRQLLEPTDLIYQDSKSLAHLIAGLLDTKLPVLLHRLPEDSLVPEAFKKACRGRGMTVVRNQTGYPYIDLKNKDGGTKTLLSSSLRSDLKRALNKATAMGEVSYQMLSPSIEQEVDNHYHMYLQVEAASWKGDAGTDLADDKERNNFFHELCRRAAQSGTLRTNFMLIDQKPVAAMLALVIDNRFWLLKIAYDKDYKRCSPGLLLIKETLDASIQNGLESYEFLGYTESWIKRWTKTERRTFKLIYYPYNIAGIKLFFYNFVKKLLRRFRKAV